MRSRPTIDQARGVLMASHSLTADQAWETLVSVSQDTNIKVRDVADQVARSAHEGPPEDIVRTRLAAALRRIKAA